MNGLFKGKYLIVYYDEEDELPLFVADSSFEFGKKYAQYNEGVTEIAGSSYISKILKGERKSPRIHFIEADTVTKDIFEEEDKEFIKFYKKYGKETIREKCKELHISERTYYRLAKEGIDVEKYMAARLEKGELDE